MKSRPLALLIVALAVVATHIAQAQTELVPNASFELGSTAPQGWSPGGDGQTSWAKIGHSGRRSLSVGPTPRDASVYWRTDSVTLKPGQLYRLSFWSRADNPGGGCIIAGLSTVNNDFTFSPTWKLYSYVFQATKDLSSYLRLGQWSGTGTVYFDDISLTPVEALNSRFGKATLGEGEHVDGDSYSFQAPLEQGNYSRPLDIYTAGFNSNRWVMQGTAQVIYRHQVGDRRQCAGDFSANVSYYTCGTLTAAASNDGVHWLPLGELDHTGTRAAPLPAALFPAATIWVRLQTANGTAASPKGDSAPGSLQVNAYSYHATLQHETQTAEDTSPGPMLGRTRYVGDLVEASDLRVRIDDLGALLPIAGAQLILVVTNPGKIALNAMASLAFSPAPGPLSNFSNKFTAMPGDTIVCIPYKIYKAGQFRMKATIRVLGTVRYQSETDFNVPSLTAADYGYRISRSGPPDLWWAESPYKISRGREAPTEVCPVIKVSAARNEYQDFQIVARPDRAVHGVLVRCSEFTGPRGARLGASYIVVREVAYVNVAQATDETGMIGDWPDPLPPLNSAVDLAAGKNQPFWITVYVPEGIPAGVYTGSVTLTAPGWRREAPVQLRVYDFTLPRETHVQSALGISPGSIRQYQNLANEGQTKDVMAKYYADFAAHRISPYNPVWGADIKVNWGLPAVNSHNVKLDFTQFDTAMDAALARYHFNTFQLPIQAMGGGTFDARNEGRIGPYAMGSPEYETLFASYARQLQDHMEAKGWLDKAYLYWFDEPAPKDYAFVRDGMERIHKYAPKLARMLTVQPVPDLYGAVDTWCMLTPNFDEVRAHERQAAGDRLWWYICCGPKAPYVTEFIDHPAIEPRLWLWQTWKYGIQGILIWETTYWNSPTAYPNSLQNPWTDAMSWVEGYHSTVGARIPWGNGDGRYLYPPNRDPANNKAPIIDGPVDSIRWEMLRDGMQDYEYFYMLQQKVNAARARGDHSAKIDAATALLDVPAQITSGMTTFSTDPQPLLRRRDKIAEAIESLKHISLANRNGDLSHDNKKHE